MENGEETKRAPSKLLLSMEMDCSLRQRQTNKIINFITGILCELIHDKDTASFIQAYLDHHQLYNVRTLPLPQHL